MQSFDHDSRMDLSSMVRLRTGRVSLFKIGVLCLSWVLASNCASQRIVGNEFVQESKGYSFVLPGIDWAVDEDAWLYERDFGYLLVKGKPEKRILNTRDRRGSNTGDLEIRPAPGEEYEVLLLNMDAGFRHKAHASKILVGTILEGDLIKFLKGDFIKTDSDLPDNLIAGYMEHLQGFYPPQVTDPAAITVRTLPKRGQAYRMEWVSGEGRRILYGIPLYKEFLFLTLQVNRNAPASVVEEGSKALDQMVESLGIRADK